ncbi:hypothetical protein HPB52_022315 [Rhipicephalus sanguineus]|uniref:ABC transporter domain-containing protein n=1 Tax=Rhipicephalus sanguineus TaxID=34632 RepID=A0A9D4Q3G4_RHISA|nr:hypothetical protein HPB52_022315 [Rhipicephalus sanguineus]
MILFAILCASPALITRAFRRISGAGEGDAAAEGVTAERLAVEKACVEGGDKTEYALVINGLSRFFGDAEVVKNASLAVRPGECLGLLGDNGSGKTTLLSMIAAIVPPSGGECYPKAGGVSGDEQKVTY